MIGTGDAAGNRLPLAQKFAGTLTAEYTTRVSFGELKFSVTENHNGSYFFDPDNVTKQRAYDMFNVSASWTYLDESVRSEEHTSELQSFMHISYTDFFMKLIQ